MTDYSEVQQIVSDMAKVKMAMNSHKGKIEKSSSRSLIGLLKQEVEELEQTLLSEEDLMHVIEEAADVQNFLLAIVHQQVIKYRSRK